MARGSCPKSETCCSPPAGRGSHFSRWWELDQLNVLGCSVCCQSKFRWLGSGGKPRPVRSWGLLAARPLLELVFQGPGGVLQLLSLLQRSLGTSLGHEGQKTVVSCTACCVIGCHSAPWRPPTGCPLIDVTSSWALIGTRFLAGVWVT